MNNGFVQKVLDWLAQTGVQDIVLCPGGRNAPFVVELEKATGFRVLSFYDERSAGFFALGRSQRDNRPVAVITTSGTAVTELISSAVEATYTETPLIFITADRPRKLRGTGAPQVIDQKDIFSSYVESSYDFEVNEEFAVNWKKQKPLHINVCFDEPLIEGPQEERSYKIASYQKPVKPTSSKVHLNKPLIVLSGMKESERLAVEQSLSGVTSPIYAESLSGLKNSTVLSSQLLKSGSSMVKKMMDDNIIDSILRIGDVPVGRFWRDLEKSTLKVVSLSSKNFQGLSHGELIYTSLESLKKESFQLGSFDWSKYQQEDHSRGKRVEELISKYPQSEVGWFNFLSQSMDSEDEVYLGNSLPIRIWDLVNSSGRKAFASRGVNGIDGQVSTALGHAKSDNTQWIILGDLTTMYDFSGFWVTPMLREMKAKVNFVVMNNKGGQIFNRIFDSSLFLNSHDRHFQKMAEFWDWDFYDNPKEMKLSGLLNFIEINPSETETKKFWSDLDNK